MEAILEELGALICNRVTIIARKKRVEKVLFKIENSLKTKTNFVSSSTKRLATLRLFKVLSTEKQDKNLDVTIDSLKKFSVEKNESFKKLFTDHLDNYVANKLASKELLTPSNIEHDGNNPQFQDSALYSRSISPRKKEPEFPENGKIIIKNKKG